MSDDIISIKVEDELLSSDSINVKDLTKSTVKSTAKKNRKRSLKKSDNLQPKKVRKKEIKDEEPVWQWWKEDKNNSNMKWNFFQHNGPYFSPAYDPLPSHVTFIYDGIPMKLQIEAEEIATFYAKMFNHEYTEKEIFNMNFMNDWRKVMTTEEKETITSLEKCDFRPMQEYFSRELLKRTELSDEQRDQLKRENELLKEKYGYCVIDHKVQKVQNFRLEPPGLFRGRGVHPLMGKVKQRIEPHDIVINCSKDSIIPSPPVGTSWKEIRHDNTVGWLASWIDHNHHGTKYIQLSASSQLKGHTDWAKYDTARLLHCHIDRIRSAYTRDFRHNEMRERQRAVALYFIDRLALRAGTEKDEDEADTVGCCSLRVEHISLTMESPQQYTVSFDFLGKDSIRYVRSVLVPKRVFQNLVRFTDNKAGSVLLFEKLTTGLLHLYLADLMPGLSAKVFRTYNASVTFEQLLSEIDQSDNGVNRRLLEFNRANREVALLCNHQRAAPRTFDKSMEELAAKITKRQTELIELKTAAQEVKEKYKVTKDAKLKTAFEKVRLKVDKRKTALEKLELQRTDRVENKEISLGTSKLNYIDPRITVAWCKKNNVPFNKVYSKTQLDKFQWALDITQPDFRFNDLESDKDLHMLPRSDSDDDD